jgi:PAS domain-containing protein
MLTPGDGHFDADQAALLDAIAESSGDAIVAKTLSGIVTRWSRAAERIYGHDARDQVLVHVARMLTDRVRDGSPAAPGSRASTTTPRRPPRS